MMVAEIAKRCATADTRRGDRFAAAYRAIAVARAGMSLPNAQWEPHRHNAAARSVIGVAKHSTKPR